MCCMKCVCMNEKNKLNYRCIGAVLPIKVLSDDFGKRFSSSINDNSPNGRDNNKSKTGLLSENSIKSIGIPSDFLIKN